MRPDLYSDPYEEQARLAAYASEERRRKNPAAPLTEEQVNSIVDVAKAYPWLSLGANVALHQANVPRDAIDYAAQLAAKSKSEGRVTNGKKARWSEVGDTVGNIPTITRPGQTAGDTAGSTGLSPLGQAAANVAGAPVRLAHRISDAAGNKVADTPVLREEAAGINVTGDALFGAAKGAARVGLAGAQFGLEALTGTAREIAAGRYSQGTSGIVHQEVKPGASVLEQTTAGQAVKSAIQGNGVDLGSGFFPAGEAAKQQAIAARKSLTVNGHAWTIGRGVANAVVQPGSKPYNILSGIVDAGVAWYGDPGALGLKKLGEARQAAKVLGNVATEGELVKAAAKADPQWRSALDEAVGLVHGERPTIVPRAVDKYMYSDGFKKIATKIADEKSPYNIWLAADKKMPVDVAHELSLLDEPGKVGAALRPHLGLDVVPGDFKGFGMQVVQNQQSRIRALNVMPSFWLPDNDPEMFVRNLDNSLAHFKVMGEERRALMDEAFAALSDGGPGRRKRLLNVVSDATKRSLMSYGVGEDEAKALTSWTQETDKVRAYLIDDAGKNVNFDFLLDADGNPVTRPQPSALVEALNGGNFLADPTAVRKIRTLTSRLKPITDNPGFKWPASMIGAFQSEIWKGLQTTRPAFFVRVESEEVARSMGSGTFDHAYDWLKFGSKAATDATGGYFDLAKEADVLAERLATETLDKVTRNGIKARLGQINDKLLEGKTQYEQALSGQAWKHGDFYTSERNLIRSGNWQKPHKAEDLRRWTLGFADDAMTWSQDPVIRRVANGGLFEGDRVPNARPGLDGIKDWLRSGTGARFRRKMEDMYPGVDFKSEAILDDWIDKSRMRVEKFGDNADLREAVATGTFNGKPLATKMRGGRVASEEFLTRLRQFAEDPASPAFVRYEQAAERASTGASSDLMNAIDAKNLILENFYGWAYGKSSDYLSRSRVFKAEYWNQVENMTQHMTEAARDEMLVNAAKANIGKARLKRLAEAAQSPAGAVDLEAVDALAKGRALDHTKQLLYDSSERSQFFDTARAVFPFGEAWKEVIGRWMKIAVENPQVPRRAQQIVQGARGADVNGDGKGFFYPDPATGEEMFGYPMPGPVADYLGVNFQGSAQGLSLGTSVMPGLGPVAGVVAAKLLPDVPKTDFIRSILFPYGEPPSVSNSVAPAWLRKLVAAGQGNSRLDAVYGNTYNEVVRQLVASGAYGTDPNEKERLLKDAKPRAQAITALRGIMQAFVPSAPQIQYLAKTNTGDVIVAELVKDLHAMQEDDYDSAIEKFTAKYGDDAYVYLIGKTRSTVGGQQASTAYGKWERENGDLIRKYKSVAGYLGPQGEGFNSSVFSRQEKQGKRVRRTADEIIADSESVIAGWRYRAAKKQIGPKPAPNQQEWLKKYKAALISDYPGWDPDAAPNNLPGKVRLLAQAKDDPKVKDTDLGHALGLYFDARSQAAASAKTAKLGWPTTAKAAAPIRQWMSQIGDQIAEDYPDFARVWDELLSHEIPEEVTGG